MSGRRAESGIQFPLPFAYQAKLAPMLWVLIGLGAIELLVVHFLISFWSPVVAAILSLLSLGTILWLVLFIRAMKRLPVLVFEDRLLMRTGKLMEVEVQGANIASVRLYFASEAVKAKATLDLGLIAYPNVLVELGEPVRRPSGRTYGALAHCLEQPSAFAEAVAALRERCRAS